MPLYHIVYLCSVRPEYSKDELIRTLHENRERNMASGVTGILIYKDGSILQVLEGKEKPVTTLYEEVITNPRFCGLFPVIRGALYHRQFDDWSMAFRDFDIVPRRIEGFSDLMNSPHPNHQIQIEPSTVRTFLESFVKPRYAAAA